MNILSRFERKLWKSGLTGSIVRLIFRAVWVRIQQIPDSERLWRTLHKPDLVYKHNGKPKPAFFRDKNGLSCDIARLSTPQRTKIGYSKKPYPDKAGVVEFSVEQVRAAGSDVSHKPVKPPLVPRRNYAHAQLNDPLSGEGESSLSEEAVFRIPQRFK